MPIRENSKHVNSKRRRSPPGAPGAPELFSINLALVAVLTAAACVGSPDDEISDDDDLPPAQQIDAKIINTLIESRLNLAREDAEAARRQIVVAGRQRIAIVDQVCKLTNAQKEKLHLASRGDDKRQLDRVAERLNEIEEFETQWKRVRDDPDEIRTLLSRKASSLKQRLLRPLFTDELLSVKVLAPLLTEEQRTLYRGVRTLYRLRGYLRTRQSPSGEITEIHLGGAELPDGGLEDLSAFPNVQFVDLEGTRRTDGALGQLKGLTELRRLELHNSSLTDAGLVHLEGMTKLEWLTLDNTQVTDAALVHLKRLTKLKCLSLSRTEVTDSALGLVTQFPNLQRLQLRNTSVSDAGLARLNGLIELEYLGLSKTEVTEAGIADLKRALPKLSVER